MENELIKIASDLINNTITHNRDIIKRIEAAHKISLYSLTNAEEERVVDVHLRYIAHQNPKKMVKKWCVSEDLFGSCRKFDCFFRHKLSKQKVLCRKGSDCRKTFCQFIHTIKGKLFGGSLNMFYF